MHLAQTFNRFHQTSFASLGNTVRSDTTSDSRFCRDIQARLVSRVGWKHREVNIRSTVTALAQCLPTCQSRPPRWLPVSIGIRVSCDGVIGGWCSPHLESGRGRELHTNWTCPMCMFTFASDTGEGPSMPAGREACSDHWNHSGDSNMASCLEVLRHLTDYSIS